MFHTGHPLFFYPANTAFHVIPNVAEISYANYRPHILMPLLLNDGTLVLQVLF
jgi:hypothetical protein